MYEPSLVFRFKDLRFYYVSYEYTDERRDQSFQYSVTFGATAECSGIKFMIPEIKIMDLHPELHAKLLGRERNVEYALPKRLNDCNLSDKVNDKLHTNSHSTYNRCVGPKLPCESRTFWMDGFGDRLVIFAALNI
jgi:hypothetical protein